MCKKIKYCSFQEARKNLAKIQLKHDENRHEQMFYYCEECACYHLTHKKGRTPIKC